VIGPPDGANVPIFPVTGCSRLMVPVLPENGIENPKFGATVELVLFSNDKQIVFVAVAVTIIPGKAAANPDVTVLFDTMTFIVLPVTNMLRICMPT
jgi:hypothetical protein